VFFSFYLISSLSFFLIDGLASGLCLAFIKKVNLGRMDLSAELRKTFEQRGFDVGDSEVIPKLHELSNILDGATAEDLVNMWDTYNMNHPDCDITRDIDKFCRESQRKETNMKKRLRKSAKAYDRSTIQSEKFLGSPAKSAKFSPTHESPHGRGKKEMPSTPGKRTPGISSSILMSPSSGITPSKAESGGVLLEHFPDGLKKLIESKIVSEEKHNMLRMFEDITPWKPPSRYMWQNLQDRMLALEEDLVSFQDRMCEQIESGAHARVADLEDKILFRDSISPVTKISQETVTYFGRIAVDPEGDLFLVGSLEGSDGQRSRLDLSQMDCFSIFPGKMVCIRGKNPSGSEIFSQQIIQMAPLARATKFVGTSKTSGNGSMRMVVASGPFHVQSGNESLTLEEKRTLFLDFNHLLDTYLPKDGTLPPEETNVDFLVLIGPFLDVDTFPNSEDTLPADDMVSLIVTPLVLSLMKNHHTHVVIVPSTRDLTTNFYCYPQHPFENFFHVLETRVDAKIRDRIHLVANPSLFRCGGDVSVAVTSMDPLFDLSRAEKCYPKTRSLLHLDGDASQELHKFVRTERMTRLCAHTLEQDRFYPLFPPSEAVPLDLSVPLSIGCSPDIVIVPSNLVQFVKKVGSSSIFVNPKRLTTARGSGQYAVIDIFNEKEEHPVPLLERIKVQIKKI
jgi:DNA polymerase alpha subunit B